MKTNFKPQPKDDFDIKNVPTIVNNTPIPEGMASPKEFEDWIRKSGAKGSFMVYRTPENPEDELGISEL